MAPASRCRSLRTPLPRATAGQRGHSHGRDVLVAFVTLPQPALGTGTSPTARAGAEVTPHQLPGGSPGRGTRSGRHSPVTAFSSGSAAQGTEEASLSPCHCRSRSSPMNDPAVTHPVGTGSAWLPDALSHIPCRFSPAGVSTREIRPRPPPDPSNRRMPRAHWRNEPRPQPRCLPAPLTARGAIPAGSSGWRSMSAVIGMCERK